ncbi:hypothetical protein B0T26DRAFT_675942 [Lasiosphaeria miniovina]|uniref:Uncharacterized protein n=1 Tax=Lasiosphaeria miniovina TaxID=1954250 RepID=A0AA40DVZ9_9PEZI|nr:uncharacterized protein B0T26DRAFT_675942 [Lasiosphaeria miniovina]KAK0717665.1 hypothetical protein B0T26DRAFT_675942 [Lasiosphaeria miniovina]
MEKIKETMKKGFERATNIDAELLCAAGADFGIVPPPAAVSDKRTDALPTTWPTREHHPSMTGGVSSHRSDTNKPASHSGAEARGPALDQAPSNEWHSWKTSLTQTQIARHDDRSRQPGWIHPFGN